MAWLLTTGIILFSGIVEEVQAAGMAVSPSGFLVGDVQPGKIYDIYEVSQVGLTVYNKNDMPKTYLLSTHRPSTVGTRRWEKGYLEIPNSEWCWFGKEELTVAAKGNGFAKIYLKVPNDEKYYNQHWVVTLDIREKPKAGFGISLAVNVRLQIETESRADMEGKPDGIIAFKPSTVRLEKVSLGRAHEGSVLIYNNDNETRSYRVVSLLQEDEARARRYLTRPYQLIPDPKWIVLDKNRLRIKPGGDRSLFLTLKVPNEQKYYGKKWEEIFLVEPDNGPVGFVRVQIETRKANAN